MNFSKGDSLIAFLLQGCLFYTLIQAGSLAFRNPIPYFLIWKRLHVSSAQRLRASDWINFYSTKNYKSN